MREHDSTHVGYQKAVELVWWMFNTSVQERNPDTGILPKAVELVCILMFNTSMHGISLREDNTRYTCISAVIQL